MAARNYSNTAVETTLNSGIGSGDSSLVVAAATGWPAAPFAALLDEGEATEELVLVGAKSGTTFSSLTRAYGGTSAAAHSGGTTVKLVVTAEDLALIWQHAHDGADDTAVVDHADLSGLGVGDPHTMYLKDKVSGGVGTEVPDHDHGDSSSAGLLDAIYATDAEVTAAQGAAESTAAAALTAHDALPDAHHAADHAASHADGGGDEVSVTDLADFSALPLGVLGFIADDTVQSGISTETDLTNMSVAVTVGTGRLIRISGFVYTTPSDTEIVADFRIKEGGTILLAGIRTLRALSAEALWVSHVFAPTSGAHTYKLALFASSGTISRNSNYPTTLLVEDLGLA